MKIERKQIILPLMLFLMLSGLVYGQEKGLYISGSGSFGIQGFKYELKGSGANGQSSMKIGWTGGFGFQCFFTRNIGISSGLYASFYQSVGKYTHSMTLSDYYGLGMQQDDDMFGSDHPREYELQGRLGNGFAESQKSYMLELPVLAMFQYGFGSSRRHGFYAGAGFKLQIPVYSTYAVQDSRYEQDPIVNISGNYGDKVGNVGAPGNPPVDWHGFGYLHNPNQKLGWHGKTKLNPSVSVSFKAGFFFALSRRVSLLVGGYFDYGLNNMIRKSSRSAALLEAPASYLPDANGDENGHNIGKGVQYRGLLNSRSVTRANLMAYGGELGVRVKLGQLDSTENLPDWAAAQAAAEMEFSKFDVYFQKLDSTTQMILTAIGRIDSTLNKVIDVQLQLTQLQNQMLEGRTEESGGSGRSSGGSRTGGQQRLEPGTISPQAAELLSEDEIIVLRDHLYFALNSNVLTSTSKTLLDKIIDIMKKHPELNMQLVGNTCNLGESNAYINVALGLKRAESTRRYMISKGINAGRLSISSHASYDPMRPNTSEANRAYNRRCDFTVFTGSVSDHF